MENPGAVTYRMSVLAADPAKATVGRLKQCFEYIAHELTHMWWGDLATFAWWDDIWLNEAFATVIGFKCVAECRPRWRLWRDFILQAIRAFELDALATTHAIHSDAATVDEAWQRFDAISYEKGASVLRMLEGYIGDDAFRDGVRIYLRRHYEANAVAADFWRALDEASRADITRIASAWITEPGHPLVDCRRDGDAVVLSQRRFFLDPERRAEQRWPIPMVLRVDGAERRVLVDGGETRLPLPRGSWAFPNVRALGFYRYALDDSLFEALLPHVPELEAEERVNLVDDQWALVRSGARPVKTFLRLLDALGGEGDRVVLGAVWDRLRWIWSYALGDAERRAFGDLVKRIFGPVVQRLGYDVRTGDEEDDRELRPIAIGALGLLAEDPATLAEARRRIDGHLDGKPVDKDLVLAFANVAAANGDLELHRRYLAHRKDVALTDVQEEQRFMYALAPFRDAKAIAANVTALLDGTIRDQDVSLLLRELIREPKGRPAYARAIRERWDRFAPLEGSIRNDVLASLAKCTEPALLKENEAFLRSRTELDMRENAGRALESMRLDGAAAARIRDELRTALA
jgi:puromycin-sensitive aminopeptidase